MRVEFTEEDQKIYESNYNPEIHELAGIIFYNKSTDSLDIVFDGRYNRVLEKLESNNHAG